MHRVHTCKKLTRYALKPSSTQPSVSWDGTNISFTNLDTRGRLFTLLDWIFERKISARKFASTETDVDKERKTVSFGVRIKASHKRRSGSSTPALRCSPFAGV
jgi:hypothetical protein